MTQADIDALQTSKLHRRGPYVIQGASKGHFSVAARFGGCTAYGCAYTYDPAADELVRDDVLRWLGKRRTEEAKAAKTRAGQTQTGLGI